MPINRIARYKLVIQTFFLTILTVFSQLRVYILRFLLFLTTLTFFSELRDTNLQLQVIKSVVGYKVGIMTFSQMSLYLAILTFFLAIQNFSHHCEFISHNSVFFHSNSWFWILTIVSSFWDKRQNTFLLLFYFFTYKGTSIVPYMPSKTTFNAVKKLQMSDSLITMKLLTEKS